MSNRPHGFARYKRDGCRCNACGWARYQWESRRSRLIAQGRWQPFVDPAPLLEYVERLRGAGLGLRQIADLAGVGRQALQDAVNGKSRQVRTETAASVLAVPLDSPVADGTLIDPTGTQRRGQALAALGWSLAAQAEEIGWLVSNYYGLMTTRPAVTAATSRLVADLYDRWSMTPPATTWKTERSKRTATRNRWFPPLAWDDERLDDREALPCLLPPVEPVDRELELTVQHLAAGHQVESTAAAVREIIRRMPGVKNAAIAKVAQTTPERVSYLRARISPREAA